MKKPNYHVAVITYDVGHIKTKRVVLGLLKKNYRVTILVFPFKKRNKKKIRLLNPKIFKCRPYPIIKNLNNENFYKKLGVEYLKISSWKKNNINSFNLKNKKNVIYLDTVSKIIPKFFIGKKTILNAHPGVLPINRGLDAFKWGIIKNYPFGVTLHKINKEVDSGIILKVKYIKINKKTKLKEVVKISFNYECDLLINFEKYVKNLKKKIRVGNNFPLSEERIPLFFEKKLSNIFEKKKNIFQKFH